jgi:hypothetical protein
VTGADLQWWHFVIVLATMLVFVVPRRVCLVGSRLRAQRQPNATGASTGSWRAGLTEDEACALVDDLP